MLREDLWKDSTEGASLRTVTYEWYINIPLLFRRTSESQTQNETQNTSRCHDARIVCNFNSADFGSATSFVTVDPNCISIDFNKQQ